MNIKLKISIIAFIRAYILTYIHIYAFTNIFLARNE